MEEVTLVAETGRITGSRSTGRLRREGKIPGVLYGHGIDPIALAVGQRELRAALNTGAGANALITLQIGGDRHLAMARQLQRHPVRGTVNHVDFIAVRRDEVISSEVPVHLEGEATAVTNADGLVSQELFALTVSSQANQIPPSVVVDISGLQPGDTVRIADLRLPTGVTTDLDPDIPVVSAMMSTLASDLEEVEEAEAEAAAEAAEEAGEAEGENVPEGSDESPSTVAGDGDAGGGAGDSA
jgi:large subunit ribosomal protein L25